MITAIVPAVDEPGIAATIASIRAQTVPVDRIIVALNNSTDPAATAGPAARAGAEVIDLGHITGRKAGAINRTLARLPRDGAVLVMDADTLLTPTWVESALVELADPAVGGVGAVFHADQPTTYLELGQYLEWVRYAEETDRTGKTFVMSGTAALVRWEALESVRVRFGRWYDESTITEDSRLSIDLKLCGWTLRSPLGCRTITETMPTVPDLFRQRRRWYLGALQNVRDTGLNRVTWPYWRQQALLAVSVALMGLYLTLTAVAAVLGGLTVSWWLVVGLIFAAERVATVWDEPWRRRLFAAVLIPELLYALILQAAYLAAAWQFVRRQAGTWHHPTTTKEIADVHP